MTRELIMSDPKSSEWSIQPVDVLPQPEKPSTLVVKTAADYIEARVAQSREAWTTPQTIELTLKKPDRTYTAVSSKMKVPEGTNLRKATELSPQRLIHFLLEGAVRDQIKGNSKDAQKLTKDAQKAIDGYGKLHGKAKGASFISALALAVAACSGSPIVSTPNPEGEPTQARIIEMLPTPEEERLMLDSFDHNGNDLSVKIDSIEGISNETVIGITRVIEVTNIQDSDYKTITWAQMVIEGNENASIEAWTFLDKSDNRDTFLVAWTPNGLDSQGNVMLLGYKMYVDTNNVASIDPKHIVAGSAVVPTDPKLPVLIVMNKPNGKGEMNFDLIADIEGAINNVVAWDARVAEAGADATQPPVVASSTPPPDATVTNQPAVTATAENTAEPIEVPVKIVEFDKIDMEINGRPVKFTIGTLEDSDIRPTWAAWGVESIRVNRNLANAPAVISKAWSAWLSVVSNDGWAWRSDQESFDVFFKDYLANHSDSPIVLSGDGSSFALRDLQSIDVLFVDHQYEGLVTNDNGGQVGFKYDQNTGKLTVFTTNSPDNESILMNFTDPQVISLLHKDTGMRQAVGNLMVTFPNAILGIDIRHTEEHLGILSYVGYPHPVSPYTQKRTSSFWELTMLP